MKEKVSVLVVDGFDAMRKTRERFFDKYATDG